MNRHPPAPLERLAFAGGDAVLARDLDTLALYEARLLALHVRAMHDTAGVAQGLRLSLSADRRQVTVAAGAAYTSCGEAIVLHRPVTIAGPRRPASGPALPQFVLALGGARVPELRWVLATSAGADALRPGLEIPLGAFTRRWDGTLDGPDYAERRTVRALSRPHIAFGTVKAGALDWSLGAYALGTHVDTTAAGFSTAPVYLVSMDSVPGIPPTYIGPFVSVEQPVARGFTLRLRFVNQPAQSASVVLATVRRRFADTAIHWMGVESARGCGASGVLS